MVGRTCAIALCSNSHHKCASKGISFHRFPRDKDLRKKWVILCMRQDVVNPDTAWVCSEHFTPDDFRRDLMHELIGDSVTRRKRLKDNVFPSVKIPDEPQAPTNLNAIRQMNRLKLKRAELEGCPEPHDDTPNTSLFATADMLSSTSGATKGVMADCIVIDDSSDEDAPAPKQARPNITVPKMAEVSISTVPMTGTSALTIIPVLTCHNAGCNRTASVVPDSQAKNYFEIPADKNVKICKECADKSKHSKDSSSAVQVVDLSSSDEREDEPNTCGPAQNSGDNKSSVDQPEIIDVPDTLDVTDLKDALEKASEITSVVRSKAKGPVCCNSWCTKPATLCPEEHIRDYYNIPPGKNFKLCKDCFADYYKFIETAERNLETTGDLLEGRSTGFNEFIILEDESDEEDSDGDPEMEKLLEAAIKETMNEIEEKYDLGKIYKENVERVCNKLENLQVQSDVLVKHIGKVEMDMYHDLEGFKNAFKLPRLALADIDIPWVDTVTEVVTVGIDPLFDEEEPDSLPPFGEILYPNPKCGETFLAMKEFQFSEWLPFKIVEIMCEPNETGSFIETYTVEMNFNNFVYRRNLNGDHLAYPDVSKVRLGVGCRVVGAFNNNCGSKLPKTWYSGMIAELPTSVNQFRYLVFFDDGKVQYCPHEDLRLICRSSKKRHEYFTGFNVEFVQSYLSKFPERAMVKTNTNHFVRVELNGFWISGKVDMLDGSIVRVTFASDKRSEWIYRGSPRLRPVFEKLQADLRNPVTNELPTIRQVNKRLAQSFREVMPSQIIIDSSDEDDDSKRKEKVRAVAKKSTSRPMQPQPTSYGQKRPEKRVTRASVVRKYPSIMQTPKLFRWHKCSYNCVTWVEYNEEKTKGINSLAIPSIFAFRRDIDFTSSVTYTAPCGKKLKNIQEVLKYLSETLIPLTLDMFDFDIRTQIFDEYVVGEQFVLMEDISFGDERNPIACVNEVDNACPDLMNYMTVRRPQEGVTINLDPGFLVCCDCTDNCRDRSKCRCWRLTIDNFKPFNQGDDKRHITKIGYQYQRLDRNVLSGIYECNSQCACNKVTCINRVVQHPTRHKLQLFKTHKKGWGTRCINDIPQGVFISTYVGNILTEPKANETGTVNGDEYFAELDHIEVMAGTKADYEARAAKMTDEEDSEEEDDPEPIPTNRRSAGGRAVRSCTQKSSKKHNSPPKRPEPTPNEEDSDSEDEDTIRKFYGPNERVYVMDAKIAGNIGRYFNHSCDPNIFVQNVYVDTHDLRFPWVAFFALRHIPAGTELTWDYGYRIGSVPGKVLYCYCQASNCRKRLL